MALDKILYRKQYLHIFPPEKHVLESYKNTSMRQFYWEISLKRSKVFTEKQNVN